ncbi:MAG TPA: molybdenum processing protein, partial [Betaproteobacteria bacterium]|nr:molybdenum processing protein [Betaproteobacteria bacterium]
SHAVAAACLGGNHLWQDLGLPDRQALSSLLRDHFSSLFAKNTSNMKWKKFFYKQLCERAELPICPAPSCRECTDYAACFGPEDGAPLYRQATAVSF